MLKVKLLLTICLSAIYISIDFKNILNYTFLAMYKISPF